MVVVVDRMVVLVDRMVYPVDIQKMKGSGYYSEHLLVDHLLEDTVIGQMARQRNLCCIAHMDI
ncbi:adhesive plaque matrix protein-like X4 [Biomphalaria pfeifferi]|uniref:Adhesive plaque matrix protein-like X4 n=1 Tax=Biomphalaria pfeifferi TaxID=112525 RepID=A0AAD8F303_BIOPF|nr:adhesive plaque matrix protein-like X4 [Biomphalaria pfeifferi]